MFVHNINPVLFELGPLAIRWYGLMYVLAFFVTYYYVKREIKIGNLKLTIKQLDNLLGLMVLGMILGARTFYFAFYNHQAFLQNPLEFFFVWHGGLSFHGGLLGVILVTIWYARKHKIKFLKLADTFVVPIALGNAFGRIGNFINGELAGVVTNLPWAVKFAGYEGARHPTQLYESTYNVIIFGILYAFRNKHKDGFLLALFLTIYAVFRFSVEFVKDLPMYGPLTMGQWLTIPMFFIGIWLIAKFK